MSEYVLSCCSTADLSKEYFKSRDIHYICFHYSLNGTDYPDDLGETMSFPDFYAALAGDAETKTYQVNVSEYYAYFEDFLKQGKDILHLCLSSGLSGTINSARSAAETLREKYPDRKIFICDSLAASSGFGLLMDKLADLRDGGMEIGALYQWAEENKLRLNHWFFSTDLTYFVKGGRISKTASIFGGLLNICPLMNVDNTGHLIPRKKIRGKNAVIREIVHRMETLADNGLDYGEKCFLSHAGCYEDAKAVADLITQRFPKRSGEVRIFDVGTTIGSHTGPGTVALFFWGAPRID